MCVYVIYLSVYLSIHLLLYRCVHIDIRKGCCQTAEIKKEDVFINTGSVLERMVSRVFRGLRPEAGNARDLSHILLEGLETLMRFRSAHARPPKPSPKA